MNWSTLSLPKSFPPALDKVGYKPFSKAQALVAILDWFTAQPLALRLELVQQCLAPTGGPEPSATAAAGGDSRPPVAA